MPPQLGGGGGVGGATQSAVGRGWGERGGPGAFSVVSLGNTAIPGHFAPSKSTLPFY